MTQHAEDHRFEALISWLRERRVDASTVRPASDDASFRRYFRCDLGGESFIVMDAPPDKEDSRPFVAVAGFLEEMGLNAPRVVASDLQQGFLLLTDLGDKQYLETLLADPERANELYADALHALGRLQTSGQRYQSSLPPYDEALLRFELSLFRDWLCGTHLNLTLSSADEAAWQSCCDVLVDNALQQPRVFVHRDYHSRNLMIVADNSPGILDFQDAVVGPYTYDLVSLLKDCYVKWSPAEVLQWAMQFRDAAGVLVGNISDDEFQRHFELMGVQRHLKAAGIFCRLNHRDGKARYLEDVLQTLDYVTPMTANYPQLDWLGRFIADRVVPAWRKPS